MVHTFQLEDMLDVNEDGPVRTTFREALSDLVTRVHEMFATGNVSLQWLETAVWIRMRSGDEMQGPIHFYEARDLGFKHGLLAEKGQMLEGGVEPKPELLAAVAEACLFDGNAKAILENTPRVV